MRYLQYPNCSLFDQFRISSSLGQDPARCSRWQRRLYWQQHLHWTTWALVSRLRQVMALVQVSELSLVNLPIVTGRSAKVCNRVHVEGNREAHSPDKVWPSLHIFWFHRWNGFLAVER